MLKMTSKSSKVRCANRECRQYVLRADAIDIGIIHYCSTKCAYDSHRTVLKRKRMDAELYDEVMERDRYQCVLCGSANSIVVHHVKYRSEGGLDAANNLVVLCTECHVPVVHGNKKHWQPLLLEMLKDTP